MLRQVIRSRTVTGLNGVRVRLPVDLCASGRRWMAAATSKQKRALNQDQLRGAKPAASSAATATAGGKADGSPTSTSSAGVPPPPPPGSASSGSILPFAAFVAFGIGAGAYYYTNVLTVEDKNQTGSISEQADVKEAHKESNQKVESATAPTNATTTTAKTTTQESQASSSTSVGVGSRVVSIQVPPKMKNQAATNSNSFEISHPQSGNRVSMAPSKPKTLPVDDASMAESAVASIQSSTTQKATEALVKSHQSLWAALDDSFFQDLDSLSNAQLKARVVQLATEMKDRTKWEAVRLKEFLAMKEKETADKYVEVLQKQRLEFEELLARRLRDKEHELVSQMQAALQSKEANIQAVIKTALDAQQNEHEEDKKVFQEVKEVEIRTSLDETYSKQMEEYKEKVAGELQEKLSSMEALADKIQKLDAALAASQSSKLGSVKAHRLSAAALALAEKLETSESASQELNALKTAAGRDGVIATALETIPTSLQTGVPTLSELQARFETVYTKCRQAILVPSGRPGLEGQLAGMVFASLKYAPSAEDAAPEDDKDNAEYVLARARSHVQLGQLDKAVEQLNKLKGQAALTAADWKTDAVNRSAVEKALKVIKMECALLNESLVD